MEDQVFNFTFLENIKVLFVGLLIYAVIFAMLKKVNVFGSSDKVNALIALLAAIIVSFTGVVTYAISFAVNWFVIIFFVVFLIVLMLLFLGVEFSKIAEHAGNNFRLIIIVLGLLFGLILIKSFFALNNAYDSNNPIEDPYVVDPSFNSGVDDITGESNNDGVKIYLDNLDSDLIAAVVFLLIIGLFVVMIGRG